MVEIPVSDDEESEEEEEVIHTQSTSVTRRVQTKKSPHFKAFHNYHTVHVILDTGAETNMIKESVAHFLGVKIKKSDQTAVQADGEIPLNIVGETNLTLVRDNVELKLKALVVSDLDVDILGGTPFMSTNDISVRPARSEISLGDGVTITYGSVQSPSGTTNAIRRTATHIV